MKNRILITGASSGFGAGAALGLAAKGHHVVAAAETWPQVRSLREQADAAKVQLEVIKLDLLNAIDLDHAATFDTDILVLNAGVMESGSLVDIPLDLVRQSFEVNVLGHLELVQRIVPEMVRKKSGKVVWLSSIAGLVAPPFLGTYAATKHAIEGIAASMKLELNPHGIAVATINPGIYQTGFNDTGAESHVQWYDERAVSVKMPSMDAALKAQHDPQPMIDAMIESIPDKKGAYRTMLPEDAVIEAKAWEKLAWDVKAG